MKHFVSPLVRVASQDDVTILQFNGPRLTNEKEIELLAARLQADGAMDREELIIADFHSVRTMATTLWGILVRLHETIRARGGRMVICNFHERLLATLEVLHLHHLLTVCTDRQDALERLGVVTPTECLA